MSRKVGRIAGLTAATVVGACATMHVEPKPGEPAATIVYREVGPPTVNTVLYQGSDDRCAQLSILAQLDGKRREKSVRIRPGARSYFMTRGMHNKAGTMSFCWNMSSFTPQPGHSYTIRTTFPGNTCFQVVMDESGREPADLIRHEIQGRCDF